MSLAQRLRLGGLRMGTSTADFKPALRLTYLLALEGGGVLDDELVGGDDHVEGVGLAPALPQELAEHRRAVVGQDLEACGPSTRAAETCGRYGTSC